MKKLVVICSFALMVGFFAGRADATLISVADYSLTGITGSYAWGQTDWNDVAGSGFVNNTADLAAVESLMSDGYTYSGHGQEINGIYNWATGGFHALEFSFNGLSDHTLDQFSFISSRSYGSSTPIAIDYALDGGGWATAAATTSGALGITTGLVETYNIALGGVTADRFRFTTNGGSQVSLHEIMIYGAGGESDPSQDQGPVVPEPATMLLFGSGLAGAFLRRKRKV